MSIAKEFYKKYGPLYALIKQLVEKNYENKESFYSNFIKTLEENKHFITGKNERFIKKFKEDMEKGELDFLFDDFEQKNDEMYLLIKEEIENDNEYYNEALPEWWDLELFMCMIEKFPGVTFQNFPYNKNEQVDYNYEGLFEFLVDRFDNSDIYFIEYREEEFEIDNHQEHVSYEKHIIKIVFRDNRVTEFHFTEYFDYDRDEEIFDYEKYYTINWSDAEEIECEDYEYEYE